YRVFPSGCRLRRLSRGSRRLLTSGLGLLLLTGDDSGDEGGAECDDGEDDGTRHGSLLVADQVRLGGWVLLAARADIRGADLDRVAVPHVVDLVDQPI